MLTKILSNLEQRGARLLAWSQSREKHLSVALVHLPSNTVTPFVTWLWNDHDEAFYFGHYFKDQHEATSDFIDRTDHYQFIEEAVTC